ncbi:MAG: hypothetical protein Q9168_007398 [Polycauliona sp. 1 TL-2023]
MILPIALLSLVSITFLCHPTLSAPLEPSPPAQDAVDPRLLPFTNEQVLASNKASIPSNPPPQGSSFCFRPIVSGLTTSACAPVIAAIRTLTLSTDEPGAAVTKKKHWVATTKSGSIYQWGIPGNPCKVKVVVDPSLGPNVEVKDDFSKEDVERAAKEIVTDCVDGRSQAGRRPLGIKGIFVTVARLGKDEKV